MARSRGWRVVQILACVGAFASAATAQEQAEPASEDEVQEYIEKSFWEGWETSALVGLNGSDGNTETFNLRAGLETERKTGRLETTARANYTLGMESGETTQNQFVAEARNDWLIEDSRWRYFVQGSAEYDDFQAWDWLLSAAAGVGYEFIDNETTLLLGRAGLGFSQEINGNDEFRPELVLGGDFEHQITERQKVFAMAEYRPDVTMFSDYRILANGGYEIMIDPEASMSLRLGAEVAYDSSPEEDFERTDLTYFAVLVWEF